MGSGWQDFRRVVPVGDGVLLAITEGGELLWYKHTNYLTGTTRWKGPVRIGSGWQGFRAVFAIIPSTPVGPR